MLARRIWAAVFTALTLLWMGFIFAMSAAPAVESDDMSLSVGYTIGAVLYRDFENWTPEEQAQYAVGIDNFVRKAAHVAEFAILGALLFITLSLWRLPALWRAPTAFVGGVLYASSDEFHQKFVPGRGPLVTDVLIDGAGVALGCLAALLLWLAVAAFLNKRKETKQ